MNEKIKQALKELMEKELIEIMSDEKVSEQKLPLKFELKMKWIFWKAKMKERFFR